MENTNQLEIINKAVLYLRDYDRKAGKSIRHMKYMTPWDLDDMRLVWRDKKELLPVSIYGRNIWLSGDKKNRSEKIKGEISMDVGDYMILQFLTKEHFEEICKVYDVFQPCRIVNHTGGDIDYVYKYCNNVDEKIIEVFFKLRKNHGIKDVLMKLWKQMGGNLIREDDRLGKRISYYKEIVERFKVDSESYKVDVDNLHLLE